MSSSGLIYAFIVGAWAVYLVPMWLRREDELNKARQTQRYTTAIKVLSHKESFERKHGAAAEREQARALPLAAGQTGAAPAAGRETLERVRAKERERAGAGAGRSGAARSGSASSAGGAVAANGRTGRGSDGVSAKLSGAGAPGPGSSSASASASAAAASAASSSSSASGASAPAASLWRPRPAGTYPVPRTGLRARRRRVVGVLFGLTSLGAIVSADLGIAYVWAMLLPAAVLSAYIVQVRKDERARAAEQAGRRAAAVRAAREAERRRDEAERAQETAARAEREELARRAALARRRVAAARSRADRRQPAPGRAGDADQGELPRAANG